MIRKKITKLANDLLSGEQHLSHSSFSAFLKSPAHFIEYKFGEKKKTDAFAVGHLIHTLLLEPQEFQSRYVIWDRNEILPFPKSTMNKKENKAAKAEFLESVGDNQEVIEKLEFEEAQAIVNAVKNTKSAKGILEMFTDFEQELNFEYGGFKWKGFKDATCTEITGDLKTTKDASRSGFKRSVRQFGYHRQAAMYNIGDGYLEKPYIIIAVEKTKPYAVGLHHMTPQLLKKGKEQIDKGLIDFRRCLADESLFLQSYEFWAKKTSGVFELDLTYY